jgi:hypothetical protein
MSRRGVLYILACVLVDVVAWRLRGGRWRW